MTETIGQRIYRNGKEILTTGKIDPAAVVNGFEQIQGYIRSIGVEKAVMGEIQLTEHYAGHEDLTVLLVPFSVGYFKQASVQIVEFPERSRLQLEVDDALLQQDYYLQHHSEATAAFTGPTIKFDDSPYPNNGFFVHNRPDVYIPFPDHPSSRHGAFAFTHDGGVEILTDDEIHTALYNERDKYSSIIGSSHYFSSEDTFEQAQGKYNHKSIVSYLLEYSVNNVQRTAHVVTRNFLTFAQCKLVLDSFIQTRTGSSGRYAAVELELSGAICAVKDKRDNSVQRINRAVQHPRHDHYVVQFD